MSVEIGLRQAWLDAVSDGNGNVHPDISGFGYGTADVLVPMKRALELFIIRLENYKDAPKSFVTDIKSLAAGSPKITISKHQIL